MSFSYKAFFTIFIRSVFVGGATLQLRPPLYMHLTVNAFLNVLLHGFDSITVMLALMGIKLHAKCQLCIYLGAFFSCVH